MKLEEGIGLVAVLFIIGMVAVALLPDDIFEGETNHSWGGGIFQGGANINPSGNNSWSAGPLQGLTVAVVRQSNVPQSNFVDVPTQQPQRSTVPQPGLLPFEQAPRVRFSGTIQQITELQKRDGQIHIWLNDDTGVEYRISVAPSWYLKYMNCTLLHDMTLSGSGFKFDNNRNGNALIYAKKIRINGQICHLRNDEGFALWSNRLR
ncbi:MAG: hypothetical protein HQL68_04465 [Magnetococcales bacterium]|nr:hypothetical protein [Magnetococcales bacterium]